jgi:hypothetical protein
MNMMNYVDKRNLLLAGTNQKEILFSKKIQFYCFCHFVTHILVVLALMPVIIPDRPAEAITRIGNAFATTVKVNNNKLAESRVGNGRTIDPKQPSRKISGNKRR